MSVQHRNNDAIVIRHQIGNTYHATTTGYAHANIDTICRAFINGHHIVHLTQLVAYHLGGNELIAAQRVKTLLFF